MWNAANRWWEYEEPRVVFGDLTPVWTRYLILIPVDRIPLTHAELVALRYL